MSLVSLTSHNFRNLVSASIPLHPKLNFFIGDNGSGKSSILESLFFVGHGKSFRTSKVEHLVTHDNNEFVINVKSDNDLQLGISKNFLHGTTQIRVNGENQNRLSVLAQNIAVQIVTPESFKLFFGGAKERRRFVDLGMFHVKQSFPSLWRDFAKLLKQRNALIRNKVNKAELAYWTESFAQYSEQVSVLREEYIASLTEQLTESLKVLLPTLAEKVSIHYSRGWSQKKSLVEYLNESYEREFSYGYTLYGAHKFDVKFLYGKMPIETQLSRGQQKLFLLALTFAQANLIAKVNRVKPILLIDDIGAELDVKSRALLFSLIEITNCQTLITAIDNSVLADFLKPSSIESGDDNDGNLGENYNMFHVKHGKISPI